MHSISRRSVAGLLLLAACRAWCATPAQDCRRDLDDLPGFLLENDAGGKDAQARYGSAHFEAALAAAQSAAAAVKSDADCLPVLSKYLEAWRHGHLQVVPMASTAPSVAASGAAAGDDRLPAMRALSHDTLLLTLRSFNNGTREPLVRLLASKREVLESHPNWIIDVRDNNGGMDSSYEPVMPWLMANDGLQVGTTLYVTPANIAGWERVCLSSAPGDAECARNLAPFIDRMKAAKTGDYISLRPGQDLLPSPADKSATHQPRRVAILTDEACGSSCEQFLLEARQSFSVKLVGRRTFGALDVSNLRDHDLPSGKRRLFYATTRSLRIPDQPVDGIGVLPDIYLPRGKEAAAPSDEIEHVRRWLEGGPLAPAN